MPYVQRDSNNRVIGKFANPQAGYAEEYLSDAHPDLTPAPTVAEANATIQAQIDTLERAQLMPRLTREVTLILMVSTASSMGVTEPQLYAANIGYKRLKDFDASITTLRGQIQ